MSVVTRLAWPIHRLTLWGGRPTLLRVLKPQAGAIARRSPLSSRLAEGFVLGAGSIRFVNQDRSDSDDGRRADIKERVRSLVYALVGPDGEVTETSIADDIEIIEVVPRAAAARAIWVSFDYSVTVGIGEIGGRWELEYSENDLDFLSGLLTSVVAGRIEEVFAPARSMVEVTLADGEIVRESGYDGCLNLLMPLPLWRRWGRRVTYRPYAQSA